MSDNYNFDPHKAHMDCVQWIKNFFADNGPGCKAVVGISGGKDSTIVAKLCAEALGCENVLGVLMPNGIQPDIDVARDVCRTIGIPSITVNIHDACIALKHAIKPALNDHWSTQTSINLPARIRMTTLYAVSQTVNGRVANTCNLSENWVGYATRYGDGAGDFSPLSELTVTEVKAIGYDTGLPAKFIDKVPTDGLCGRTDEENLGFSYDTLDRYIRLGIAPADDIKALIDKLHEKNMFKLMPMPSYEYIA